LAGLLLTGSIVLSAETAQPLAASPASRPQAVQAAPRAPETLDQTGPTPHALSDAGSSAGETNPAQAVRQAWQRAKDLGIYHFATSLVEMRYPVPSLANTGRGPQEQHLRLEGDADLPADKLTMQLWQGAGSAANPADASEILIEDGGAYTRRAGSDTWEPVEDFSGNFAPGSDLMSYLAGIKNVKRLGTEARGLPGSGEVRFTRYTFEMDGPTLAIYMRDRLEQVLLQQGKLPPGVTLETAREYRDLTGEGEVWLDERGLPMRLALHLVYPPEANGSHSEADLQSDFSRFPEPLAAAPSFTAGPIAWASAPLRSAIDNPRSVVEDLAATGRWAIAWACTLALVALILVCRRSRKMYVAVAVAGILAMTVMPLLKTGRVVAFMEEQAARQTDSAERMRGEEASAALASQAASWDPHRSPLSDQVSGPLSDQVSGPVSAAPSPSGAAVPQPAGSSAPLQVTTTILQTTSCNDQDTADTDGDGLSNYEECMYDTDPNMFDMDGDGLSDGQEVTYLGTGPGRVDSDGDMIGDALEVGGFVYPASGQRW